MTGRPPPPRAPNRLIVDDEEEGAPVAVPASGAVSAPPAVSSTREARVMASETPLRAEATPGARAARRPQRAAGEGGERSHGQGPYPGRRQVTAHIDRQLFLWLKRISAETDKPMVEIFEEALNDFVNSYAAKLKFGDKAR